jgi:HlyD family secretion protein
MDAINIQPPKPEGKAPASPMENAVRTQPSGTKASAVRRRAFIAIGLLIIAAAIGGIAFKYPLPWKEWLGYAADPRTLLVSGNIEAHESQLSFKTVQGRIVELPFNEGQWVDAGAVIARIDDRDYRQQLVIAQSVLEVQQRQLATVEQNLVAAQKTVVSDQADVAMKKLDYDRTQALWSRGNATTQVRDQAATALKQSQAALERDQAMEVAAERNIDLVKANIRNAEESLNMAKIVLDYAVLSAPFAGVVQVRQAELGEMEISGQPIATLADLDHVWLRAYINETDIARVRLGTAVNVATDTYPGKTYPGRVSFISSSAEFTPKTVETHAERVSLVYRIKIDIDNPTHELVPGMPADAVIDVPAP